MYSDICWWWHACCWHRAHVCVTSSRCPLYHVQKSAGQSKQWPHDSASEPPIWVSWLRCTCKAVVLVMLVALMEWGLGAMRWRPAPECPRGVRLRLCVCYHTCHSAVRPHVVVACMCTLSVAAYLTEDGCVRRICPLCRAASSSACMSSKLSCKVALP